VKISERKGDNDAVCIEVLGKYTQPVFVNYRGIVEEISIVFKPLGINRFITADHVNIAPDYSQPFSDDVWLQAARGFFSSDDKIEALEQFLLSVFREKDEFQSIQRSLDIFEDRMDDSSLVEVAEKLNMNLKTFQRNFKKALACSPSDYRRIARFRNSLNSKFHAKEIKSLTDITYENNYSDQSYFIREFRKLTNQNPKFFFKEASLIDGDKIVWEIL
jgi:AraC-like DNA-binding protein